LVLEVIDAVIAGGAVKVTIAVIEQPFESVTATV
jgi:hypothetical protein